MFPVRLFLHIDPSPTSLRFSGREASGSYGIQARKQLHRVFFIFLPGPGIEATADAIRGESYYPARLYHVQARRRR
jgi:hypothetical protein